MEHEIFFNMILSYCFFHFRGVKLLRSATKLIFSRLSCKNMSRFFRYEFNTNTTQPLSHIPEINKISPINLHPTPQKTRHSRQMSSKTHTKLPNTSYKARKQKPKKIKLLYKAAQNNKKTCNGNQTK